MWGTTLLITPKIHSAESVTIRITQEDSQLGEISAISYGADTPFKSQDVETRSVTTTVVAADGQISAVGGLIREDASRQDSGIPGLMRLPGVGGLFKTTRKAASRTELIVLLRPYILRAPEEGGIRFYGISQPHQQPPQRKQRFARVGI